MAPGMRPLTGAARALAAVVVLAALGACATSRTLPAATLDPVLQPLPDIRLKIDDGQEGDYHVIPYGQEISRTIASSHVFRSINSTATGNRVTVFLSIVPNRAPGTMAELAAAATLMVLPQKEDFTFRLQVAVEGLGGPAMYEYEDRRAWTRSMLLPGEHGHQGFDSTVPVDAVRNMVIRFLNDVRRAVSPGTAPGERAAPPATTTTTTTT